MVVEFGHPIGLEHIFIKASVPDPDYMLRGQSIGLQTPLDVFITVDATRRMHQSGGLDKSVSKLSA